MQISSLPNSRKPLLLFETMLHTQISRNAETGVLRL